jgi:hypothetical protein
MLDINRPLHVEASDSISDQNQVEAADPGFMWPRKPSVKLSGSRSTWNLRVTSTGRTYLSETPTVPQSRSYTVSLRLEGLDIEFIDSLHETSSAHVAIRSFRLE